MRFNRVVGSQDGVGIGECVLNPRKGWMEPIDSSRFLQNTHSYLAASVIPSLKTGNLMQVTVGGLCPAGPTPHALQLFYEHREVLMSLQVSEPFNSPKGRHSTTMWVLYR